MKRSYVETCCAGPGMPKSLVVGPRNSRFSASTPSTKSSRDFASVRMLRRSTAMSTVSVVVVRVVRVLVGRRAARREVRGEVVDRVLGEVDGRCEVSGRKAVVVDATVVVDDQGCLERPAVDGDLVGRLDDD